MRWHYCSDCLPPSHYILYIHQFTKLCGAHFVIASLGDGCCKFRRRLSKLLRLIYELLQLWLPKILHATESPKTCSRYLLLPIYLCSCTFIRQKVSVKFGFILLNRGAPTLGWIKIEKHFKVVCPYTRRRQRSNFWKFIMGWTGSRTELEALSPGAQIYKFQIIRTIINKLKYFF